MILHQFVYPSMARYSQRARQRSHQFSPQGKVLQLGLISTAVLGIDTSLTLNYQFFSLFCCLYAASRLGSRFRRPKLTLKRTLPKYVTAQVPFEYHITITNDGTQLEKDLQILDIPKNRIPTREEFLNTPEPFEASRNLYDRAIGVYRFFWLQRQKTGLTIEPTSVPALPIDGNLEVKIKALPLRRGIVSFQKAKLSFPEPLGFMQGLSWYPLRDSLLVLPKRYKIPPSINLEGGRHYQPGGFASALSVGESDEFTSLREFRDGDSIKRVHWASSAKRDTLMVKEYEDEYYVRQALVLDNCCHDLDVMEEIISLAASFAMKVDTGESILDLMFLANGPIQITAGRGLCHAEQLLEVLAGVQSSTDNFEAISKHILAHSSALSSCLLLLSQWDESRQQLAEKLRAQQIEVKIFVIQQESTPAIEPSVSEGTYVHILQVGLIEESLALVRS